jgi:hypothetical protein
LLSKGTVPLLPFLAEYFSAFIYAASVNILKRSNF